ncbi:beta-galactosidase 3 [Artemisia annua]|uniref:Beta-galactosidase 3 n=1 Tax=Artemisia annua TaxID=35608 RepID=A0A2U1KER7_ARTAN|nr:beta-galactosidase 3 [Artemisia annua]
MASVQGGITAGKVFDKSIDGISILNDKTAEDSRKPLEKPGTWVHLFVELHRLGLTPNKVSFTQVGLKGDSMNLDAPMAISTVGWNESSLAAQMRIPLTCYKAYFTAVQVGKRLANYCGSLWGLDCVVLCLPTPNTFFL